MPDRTVIGNYVYAGPSIFSSAFTGTNSWISPTTQEPSGSWELGSHGTGGQDGNVPVGSSWNSTIHDYTSIYITGQEPTLYGNAWKRNNFEFTYEPGMRMNITWFQSVWNSTEETVTSNTNFQGIAFIPAANTDGTWFNDPALLELHLFQFGGNEEKGNAANPYHRAYSGGMGAHHAGQQSYDHIPLEENNPFIVGTKYNIVFVQDITSPFSWQEPELLPFTTIAKLQIGTTKSGIFVSKPGIDIYEAGPGDLLFDSTAPDFLQVLEKGIDTIAPAISSETQTVNTIYTSTKTPYAEEKATILVRWSTLVPSSNVHQTAFPSSWNTPASDSYVVVPPYLNLDHINLENPSSTGVVPGYSLTARTYANTDNTPATVDIEFTNGSPYKEHLVAWTLYRAKGV